MSKNALLVLLCLSFALCDYEVKEYTEGEVTYFEPQGCELKNGVIFYVGTAISPSKYPKLGNMIASKGYLVAIPQNTFAYVLYSVTERQTASVLKKFPNVKFFLSGHSQGGGAATKMSKSKIGEIWGTMLLSPLSYEKDSIADSGLPVLFFEAQNDKVLSDSQKEESKKTLPADAQQIFLEGCNHMGYSDSTFIFDGECTIGVENQQKITFNQMLDFMEKVLGFK
ncbi:MAG: alpha/beta hydrolase [archaeon]|nr:alpha/beta hydrolase [archaeon]